MTTPRHSVFFVLLLFSFFNLSEAVRTAEIVSCNKWKLQRYQDVKLFLINGNRDGGAEGYEGVSVKWIPGNDPIMTIYDDGIEKEKIDLTKFKSIPDMHQMMVDKGFVQKVVEEEKGSDKDQGDGKEGVGGIEELEILPTGQTQGTRKDGGSRI